MNRNHSRPPVLQTALLDEPHWYPAWASMEATEETARQLWPDFKFMAFTRPDGRFSLRVRTGNRYKKAVITDVYAAEREMLGPDGRVRLF